MNQLPKVSIIIPVYNQLSFSEMCLDYLRANTPEELYECIVVDNASNDGTVEYLEKLKAPFRAVRRSARLTGLCSNA